MNNYVKFMKFEHALHAIINDSIKFSSIYEFNDIAELLVNTWTQSKEEKNLEEDILNRYYSTTKNRASLIKHLEQTAIYTDEYKKLINDGLNNCTEISKIIPNNSPNNIPGYLSNITKDYLFSNIGIFCISSEQVFQDDKAIIMFAHYGDNIKGLALIYEIPYPVYPVDYCGEEDKNTNFKNILNLSDRLLKKIDKSITKDEKIIFEERDIEFFLVKSNAWKYECEHRVFGKVGICKASDYNIKLKTIAYYPPMMNEENLKTLKAIAEPKNIPIIPLERKGYDKCKVSFKDPLK